MTALRDASDADVPDSAQTMPTRIVAQSRAFRKLLCPFCEQRKGGVPPLPVNADAVAISANHARLRTPRSLRWQAAGYTMLTPIVSREPALRNLTVRASTHRGGHPLLFAFSSAYNQETFRTYERHDEA